MRLTSQSFYESHNQASKQPPPAFFQKHCGEKNQNKNLIPMKIIILTDEIIYNHPADLCINEEVKEILEKLAEEFVSLNIEEWTLTQNEENEESMISKKRFLDKAFDYKAFFKIDRQEQIILLSADRAFHHKADERNYRSYLIKLQGNIDTVQKKALLKFIKHTKEPITIYVDIDETLIDYSFSNIEKELFFNEDVVELLQALQNLPRLTLQTLTARKSLEKNLIEHLLTRAAKKNARGELQGDFLSMVASIDEKRELHQEFFHTLPSQVITEINKNLSNAEICKILTQYKSDHLSSHKVVQKLEEHYGVKIVHRFENHTDHKLKGEHIQKAFPSGNKNVILIDDQIKQTNSFLTLPPPYKACHANVYTREHFDISFEKCKQKLAAHIERLFQAKTQEETSPQSTTSALVQLSCIASRKRKIPEACQAPIPSHHLKTN
ncbi:MAG: hypothetical protein K0S08_1577 [Gammaproteobacteria bacterium]|nr:hypothetical protein [Gammaproteobacteria bacterium]